MRDHGPRNENVTRTSLIIKIVFHKETSKLYLKTREIHSQRMEKESRKETEETEAEV